MSSEQDTAHTSPAFRLIHHVREQAMAAVQRYDEACTLGGVSEDVQRQLATAALDYYNALHEYRDEDALNEPWDERGITWLEQAEGSKVTVDNPLPRSNSATQAVLKPALMEVPAERLRDTIRELNDVAKELGFAAQVSESTYRTEIDEDLIEEVEKWRQQNLDK